ncbi:MAG: hypothetical protein EBS06_01085 [Proteobacteria bacterium]|nr:hypothetical protein [Pseudomonadota bacterium]
MLLRKVRKLNSSGVPENNIFSINQFTERGLDLLVDYYNAKYPDRGQIHRIRAVGILNHDPCGIFETPEKQILQMATLGINELKKNNPSPIKVMLTFLQKDTPKSDDPVERGRHSVPLLITNEKLIMLRDDTRNPVVIRILGDIAKNLSISFIHQKEPAFNDKGNQTSIQSDYLNCDGIAIGILKDLTAEDLSIVSAFENFYIPLPKMLKYSQSKNFILKNYPELANEPIKFNEDKTIKTTLIDYVRENSRYKVSNLETEQEVKEKVSNRISNKMDRMRQDMAELSPEDQSNWTKKILEKRMQERQSKKEETER